MRFWERLTLAGSVIFSGKTAYEFSTPTWQVGQAVYPEANFRNNVVHGYRKNELIYSCIAKKADSAATPVLRVHRKSDGEELPNHPANKPITQPNDYMSGFDLISITLMMLDLAGRACWEKQRSKAGQVTSLWPLRPDWLRYVMGPIGMPQGYQYGPEGKAQPISLDAKDVLEFKVFDPLNLYDGLAPVSVAGRVGDVDNAATDYLKKFFEQGGIPPGILSSKLKLTDPAVADIRRRWKERYGGWQNWTEPAVLDSDASYQQTGMSFKDMGFDVLDGRSEARICMVLRVPPILVGAKVGLDRSTFANYAEARKAWWQDDLSPQYRRIAAELNNDLASEFGSDIEYRWDFSEVPAFQEDQTSIWTRGIEAMKARGISVDEFRDMIGLPPALPDQNFLAAPVAPSFAPPKPQQEEDEPEPEDEEAEPGVKSLSRKAEDEPPDADERRKAEAALQADMESYFSRQQKRILGAVDGSAS